MTQEIRNVHTRIKQVIWKKSYRRLECSLFDFYQDQAGEAEDQSYKCQLVIGLMGQCLTIAPDHVANVPLLIYDWRLRIDTQCPHFPLTSPIVYNPLLNILGCTISTENLILDVLGFGNIGL